MECMKYCFPKHRGAQPQEELCQPQRQKSPSLQAVPMAPVLVFAPRGLRTALPPLLSMCLILLPLFFGHSNHHKQQPETLPCLYPGWVTVVGSSIGWYQGGLYSWHTSSHEGAQSSLTIFSGERRQELPVYDITFKNKLAKLTLKWILKV